MKIAIDVSASVYEGTGVASYFQMLIPKLIPLANKRGHKITTFGYSLRRYKKLVLAEKKYPFPPAMMEIIWNKLHILPAERFSGNCDLVHTWDYIQPPTRKAAIITTLHDLTPLKYPREHLPRTIRAYHQGLHWIKKEAEAIIVDSLTTKQDVVEILEYPEKQVFVVYLAASETLNQFEKLEKSKKQNEINRVKKKYNIQGDYLLFVGTHEPRKNLERVVAAFHPLRNQYSLVLAGKVGWGKQIKPSENILLAGYINDSDLPALYAGASCFIYPSLYEGFGMPVVEAMAVGCPVVTSDRGSTAEIAGDGAVLVNPENVDAIASGIVSAINNYSLLYKKGVERANEFSWDLTAEYTLKVYEKILSGK